MYSKHKKWTSGLHTNFMIVVASRQAGWGMRSEKHAKGASTVNHTQEAKC